ncbi:MAG: GNAT family N-acetyltransferase [Acidobacteriota bacterium]
MQKKIIKVINPTIKEWDEIWNECKYATFFHSREWAELWYQYSNKKLIPDPKILLFNDNVKILLPFTYRTHFHRLIKEYVSSPAGTYGSWISSDRILPEHSELTEKYIKKKIKNISLRINPYNKHISELIINQSRYDFTQAINLTIGFASVRENLKKKYPSSIRKVNQAIKGGVSIRQGVSLEDWENYFDLYSRSLERWGNKVSSSYGWQLFYNMYLSESSNIKLWLSEYDSRIIAGGIFFYSRCHVIYWHGATNEKYFKLRPVNLLMQETIRNACENGYHWFDFNPSGGHEGVVNFKNTFNPEKLKCPVVKTRSIMRKFVDLLPEKLR